MCGDHWNGNECNRCCDLSCTIASIFRAQNTCFSCNWWWWFIAACILWCRYWLMITIATDNCWIIHWKVTRESKCKKNSVVFRIYKMSQKKIKEKNGILTNIDRFSTVNIGSSLIFTFAKCPLVGRIPCEWVVTEFCIHLDSGVWTFPAFQCRRCWKKKRESKK